MCELYCYVMANTLQVWRMLQKPLCGNQMDLAALTASFIVLIFRSQATGTKRRQKSMCVITMYEILELLLLSVHDKFLLENIVYFCQHSPLVRWLRRSTPLLLPIKIQTRYNIFNVTMFYFCKLRKCRPCLYNFLDNIFNLLNLSCHYIVTR